MFRLSGQGTDGRFPAHASAVSALDADTPQRRSTRIRMFRRAEATYHVVDDSYSRSHRRRLEAHVGVTAYQLLDCDAARRILVEIDALHLLRTLRHRLGWLQDCISGAGRGRRVASHGDGRSRAGSRCSDTVAMFWACLEAVRRACDGCSARTVLFVSRCGGRF
jgi:hypothetical protein